MKKKQIEEILAHHNKHIQVAVNYHFELQYLKIINNKLNLNDKDYLRTVNFMFDIYNCYKQQDDYMARIVSLQDSIVELYQLDLDKRQIKMDYGIK